MQQEIETLKHTIATQRELSAEELNSHNTRIYLLETNQAAVSSAALSLSIDGSFVAVFCTTECLVAQVVAPPDSTVACCASDSSTGSAGTQTIPLYCTQTIPLCCTQAIPLCCAIPYHSAVPFHLDILLQTISGCRLSPTYPTLPPATPYYCVTRSFSAKHSLIPSSMYIL